MGKTNRINCTCIADSLRIIMTGHRESIALMTKHRNALRGFKKAWSSTDLGVSEVYRKAENLRDNLAEVWDRLWPLLSNARSEGEVTKAFQDGDRPYDQNFVPSLSALTLQVLQEPTLPKDENHCNDFWRIRWQAGSGDSASLSRHLRPRKSKEKACSSHSSIRVLCRVFVWLQGTLKESRLPKVWSGDFVSVGLASLMR